MLTVLIVSGRVETEAVAARLADGLAAAMLDHATLGDPTNGQNAASSTKDVRRLVRSSRVVVVVIGRFWLNAADDRGRRCLDVDDDVVRTALETALADDVAIIAVLVQDAEAPVSGDLPPALASLADRPFMPLRHDRWVSDMGRLVDRIEATVADLPDSHRGLARRLYGFVTRRVPRGLQWQRTKQLCLLALVAGTLYAAHYGYRYVTGAPERKIREIAATLSLSLPVEKAAASISTLEAIAVAQDRPVVTDLVVSAMKPLFFHSEGESEDRKTIRQLAMNAIRKVRDDNVSGDFVGQGLADAELDDLDLSQIRMPAANLKGASLERTRLTGADLRDANLSGAFVLGSDLSGAILDRADINILDWFNARGVTREQLRSVRTATRQMCPKDAGGQHSVGALQALFEEEYRRKLSELTEDEQRQLIARWREYSAADGLCQFVASLPR